MLRKKTMMEEPTKIRNLSIDVAVAIAADDPGPHGEGVSPLSHTRLREVCEGAARHTTIKA